MDQIRGFGRASGLRNFLIVNRDSVLQRWAREAHLDPVNEVGRHEPWNRTATFLEALVGALDDGHAGEVVGAPAANLASKHEQPGDGDDPGSAVRRYGTFGDVILDAAEDAGFDLTAYDHRALLLC